MVRTHGTMTDLWQEWSVGWAGRPSIQFLDDTWGHRWRRGKEASFYSRRRLIIGETRRLAARPGRVGLNLADAAEELETRRRQAGLSLTGLNEQLRRPQPAGRENGTQDRANRAKKGRQKGKRT